jgi:hypothetical protein
MNTAAHVNFIFSSLMALWAYSIWQFTRWRTLYLERKAGDALENPLNDWMIQVFVRISALLLLVVIVILQLR